MRIHTTLVLALVLATGFAGAARAQMRPGTLLGVAPAIGLPPVNPPAGYPPPGSFGNPLPPPGSFGNPLPPGAGVPPPPGPGVPGSIDRLTAAVMVVERHSLSRPGSSRASQLRAGFVRAVQLKLVLGGGFTKREAEVADSLYPKADRERIISGMQKEARELQAKLESMRQ